MPRQTRRHRGVITVFHLSDQWQGRRRKQLKIFVTSYPCAPSAEGAKVEAGSPIVHLYDQAHYGESGSPKSIEPSVTVTKASSASVDFYFDIAPGNYDAFVQFPTSGPNIHCGRNGPLVVLPGKARHPFLAPFYGATDWHAPGAVAGTLPTPGLDVSVLVYDKPMKCGDDVRSYDPKTFKATTAPHTGNAVIDDGAFYQNIHAYGKQDHTIALSIWGALFSHATILLTQTPDTKPDHPPFIEKNLTSEMLHAAIAAQDDEKLVCIPGF